MPRITPRFRPLEHGWVDDVDPHPKSAVFRVDDRRIWSDLSDEVMHLQDESNPDEVVVQLDVPESDIRVDGTGLKAGAKIGYHGVVVSFESRHGPLRYAADHYNDWGFRQAWRANVRAITLTLESLRAIDRHGVAQGGQQYAGWKALGAGSGPISTPGAMTIAEAMGIIENLTDYDAVPWRFSPRVERLSETSVMLAYRMAAKYAHPDTPTGSADAFAALSAAKDVLMRNAR